MGCDDVAAKRVAPALQAAAGAKLLACSRMQPMRLWDFQQRYCIREGCPDSAEIFADLEIDAVYLATPVFLHCLHTIEAAEQKQTNALRESHGMEATARQRRVDTCRSLVHKVQELLTACVLCAK